MSISSRSGSRSSAFSRGLIRRTDVVRWTAVALLVLSALGAGTTAEAQRRRGGPDPREIEAREHFNLGRAAYDRGDFLDAAREFEAALELSGRDALRYNIFLAYRDAGELDKAIEVLEQFIPTVEDPRTRGSYERRLAALKRSQARKQAGQPVTDETANAEGATDSSAPTEAPPPEPAKPLDMKKLAPFFVIGGGGLGVAVGGLFGALALGAHAKLDSICVGGCEPGYEAIQGRGRVFAILADVLIPAGAITAGVGVILVLLGNKKAKNEDPDQAPPPVVVGCAAEGCVATFSGTF